MKPTKYTSLGVRRTIGIESQTSLQGPIVCWGRIDLSLFWSYNRVRLPEPGSKPNLNGLRTLRTRTYYLLSANCGARLRPTFPNVTYAYQACSGPYETWFIFTMTKGIPVEDRGRIDVLVHCTTSKLARRTATEQATESIALKWQNMRRLRHPCLDVHISSELNRFRTEFTWAKIFQTRATTVKPGIIKTSLASTRVGMGECCSGSAWWGGQWLMCG